jgi:hypothetical protein
MVRIKRGFENRLARAERKCLEKQRRDWSSGGRAPKSGRVRRSPGRAKTIQVLAHGYFADIDFAEMASTEFADPAVLTLFLRCSSAAPAVSPQKKGGGAAKEGFRRDSRAQSTLRCPECPDSVRPTLDARAQCLRPCPECPNQKDRIPHLPFWQRDKMCTHLKDCTVRGTATRYARASVCKRRWRSATRARVARCFPGSAAQWRGAALVVLFRTPRAWRILGCRAQRGTPRLARASGIGVTISS